MLRWACCWPVTLSPRAGVRYRFAQPLHPFWDTQGQFLLLLFVSMHVWCVPCFERDVLAVNFRLMRHRPAMPLLQVPPRPGLCAPGNTAHAMLSLRKLRPAWQKVRPRGALWEACLKQVMCAVVPALHGEVCCGGSSFIWSTSCGLVNLTHLFRPRPFSAPAPPPSSAPSAELGPREGIRNIAIIAHVDHGTAALGGDALARCQTLCAAITFKVLGAARYGPAPHCSSSHELCSPLSFPSSYLFQAKPRWWMLCLSRPRSSAPTRRWRSGSWTAMT